MGAETITFEKWDRLGDSDTTMESGRRTDVTQEVSQSNTTPDTTRVANGSNNEEGSVN